MIIFDYLSNVYARQNEKKIGGGVFLFFTLCVYSIILFMALTTQLVGWKSIFSVDLFWIAISLIIFGAWDFE
jgi:hypothetical protein